MARDPLAQLDKVLVVGGGIAGMSAVIRLAEHGVIADLIDADPEWRVLGAGISITGPTLRAFRDLGILDAVREEGFFSSKVKFFTQDGAPRGESEMPQLEPEIPAAGGVLRPALHRILAERTKATGADIRLGLTVESMSQNGKVNVRFTDGSERSYDLVVGADGASSKTRRMLFPDSPVPQFTGQGCWRALADRPPEVSGAEIYFGEDVKAGINPCSSNKMYLFVTSAMPGNPWVDPEQGVELLREMIRPFGGTVAKVREGLGPSSSFNYRPLEAMLLPRPWSKGRVGVIGDAAHATTPHLASGAGIAVEDGLVLADEMAAAETVEQGWAGFEERRWERCKLVVETSVKIGATELAHGSQAEIAGMMGMAAQALGQPI
jgi:2-polyprenyl-6-methoxyphenol hydroxylase-like FAD-dependent oxidoreductase